MNDLLSARLHDELQHVTPDLERLAAGALVAGRRRRAVRRGGIALAGAGAASGVAAIALLLGSGGSDPDTATDPQVASEPSASPTRTETVTVPPEPEAGPVIPPAEWTCEWFLIDDKAGCESADGGVASLVIRPAREHDPWLSSPDKGNDPGVYVSEVHDGIFITVQGGAGTTNAEIQALGEGLVWAE